MKRKLLSLLLFAPVLMFAQTQRTVMVEHFSNASCGPCAALNPALNTLLTNNVSKAVSLKYQVSWPGVDPMYSQNTTDPTDRVNYYNVSGVPNSQVDGDAYSGSPSGVTQTLINNRYGTSAPFSLGLSHYLSSDLDSVYITATVTAAQSFTSNGALKLHVALAEELIQFPVAPGTNGETSFKHVARKMYPSSSGTALNGTWSNAQTQTFTFAEALPNYIYDLNMIEIIGFIQDNGNMDVLQAGKSAAQPLVLDGSVTAISALPVIQCTPSVSPTFTLKNTGATTLTSADVNVTVDAGTPSVVNWTGTLASGATTTVNIPAITASSGGHTLKVEVSNVNGSSDANIGNNTVTAPFNIFTTSSPAPVVQDFESTTFPPSGWVNNNQGTPNGWSRRTSITGHAGSTSAVRAYFFNMPANEADELYLPQTDLSGNATDTVTLSFWVAYRQYATGDADKIEVLASSDCGASWTTAFSKSGATLSTVAPATTSFAPTAASQWRQEIVDLSAFANQANVMIKFVATSDYGNNGFIDDVNLTKNGSVVISNMEEVLSSEMLGQNYPNPAGSLTYIPLSGITEGMNLLITDITGRTVLSKKLIAGQSQVEVETSVLNNGVYVYQLLENNHVLATRKMTISK